jgi:aspartyl/glutamyl-tRNA(Asn/Gln) amidotransferase C subunit
MHEPGGGRPESGGPTAADVAKAARLARIELSGEQARAMRRELRGLLDQAAHLGELDLADVEPMSIACDGENRWDADEPAAWADGSGEGAATDWRQNMPDRAGPFFRVPRVIDGGG